jgi:stage V sporulation protein AC
MDRTQQVVDQKEYQKLVNQKEPKPTLLKNIIWAFIVGGLICVLGQVFLNYFVSKGISPKEAGTPVAIIMVFLGAFFTGLGWYDLLGKVAGAGSVVPITGFANSVVSPAMEFRREGLVMGVGAKMFLIAGPVIVFGVITSAAVGLIYYLFAR